MKIYNKALIIIIFILTMLTSCTVQDKFITIKGEEAINLIEKETIQLEYTKSYNLTEPIVWTSSSSCATVSEKGLVIAISEGTTTISVTCGAYSDSVTIIIIGDKTPSITLTSPSPKIEVGTSINLEIKVKNLSDEGVIYDITLGSEYATIENNVLTGVKEGTVTVVAKKDDVVSNAIEITIITAGVLDSIELTASKYQIDKDESITLNVKTYPSQFASDVTIEIIKNKDAAKLEGNTLTGILSGYTIVCVARCGNIESNHIEIKIVESGIMPTSISLSIDKEVIPVGDSGILSIKTIPENATKSVQYEILSGSNNFKIIGNEITCIGSEEATIIAKIGDIISNVIVINENGISVDPYVAVTEEEFYENYIPAESYLDSYYRTKHNFMSGSIEEQNQEPTISNYQPKEDGKYLRNSAALYSNDKNTYFIVDSYGNIVNEVYKGAAYITLEEVASYVFAFGNIPANYTKSKKTSPTESPWGIYLRLNNTSFSGNTKKYPYEPELPRINGCGGDLYYYEMDLGTTGTDCDPDYQVQVYNDSKKITRGAARIVYTRYDKNKDEIIDINEKYLFYTYNHYNDFQEYLNYEGGWGEMFGNITGGGTLSSKYDYNPTPYPDVEFKNFITMN